MYRNWIYTDNNPTEQPDFSKHPLVKYAIYQEEKGENGTVHHQGYLELKNPSRISGLKKILPRAHFEPRHGTQQQAIDYCSKLDTRVSGPYEYGQPKTQGKRNDLSHIKQLVDEGKTLKEIADEHFSDFVRYNKGIEKYMSLSAAKRFEKTEVTLILGKPRLGKTHLATERCDRPYYKSDSKWWDNYNGTDDVILDDFYGWLPFHTMLRLLDKYPYTVESKGGTINFNPKRIFITSNKPIEEWYHENDKKKYDFNALIARIENFILFTDYKVYEEYSSYSQLLAKFFLPQNLE